MFQGLFHLEKRKATGCALNLPRLYLFIFIFQKRGHTFDRTNF